MKQTGIHPLLKNQYDSWYQSGDAVFGTEPLPSVAMVPELMSGGTVLDVGGGDGKHALFLARQGFAVTVTDISKVGLEKIRQVAAVEDLPVETKLSDVTVDGIESEFDVIICTNVLHHFTNQAAVVTLATMQFSKVRTTTSFARSKAGQRMKNELIVLVARKV
jgi:2-polyprenyl-3-methyl-5-hydroxy-6-metoxy-1,4-benzoquinol methylase